MAIRPEILGKGWAFPFRFTTIGKVRKITGVAQAESIQKIVMAIQQILGTVVGSRVIDRDFGSRLKGLVFDPIDELTAQRLRIATSEAIQRWEKRVQLISVEINLDRRQEAVLEAHIKFMIISTQVEGNLVYPYYITPEMRVQGQLNVGTFSGGI